MRLTVYYLFEERHMQSTWLWGYLIPVGFLLLTWGGLKPQRARKVTPLAALALALAVLGYWAVGYAFHMGGAQALTGDPALEGLDRIWSPLDAVEGTGWGLIGLSGFGLSRGGEPLAPAALGLFLTYLPLIASAALLVTLALSDGPRWVMVVAGVQAATVVVPLGAAWTWGGGWLSQLGHTMELGQGFVDFGGSGIVLWLPAAMAAGVLLARPPAPEPDGPPAPPPAYFPLLANTGALLLGVGWLGWALSEPFHTFGAALDWNRAAVNVLLAMAGSVLTSQLYAWLATDEVEPLIAARGLTAGWGVSLAGAPFLPGWAAIMVGLIAGVAFPLALYLTDGVLRWKDSAATVALGLTGGLLGLLGVAFFADGRWGAGWNGVEGTGGVAGLFAGGGGQGTAQFVGLVALALWGLLWGALLGGLARLLAPRPPREEAEEVEVESAVVAVATEEGPEEGEEVEVESAVVIAETEPEPAEEAGEGDVEAENELVEVTAEPVE
jgi:Amt family ammonium transporter